MKKFLYMAVAAIAALSSCSNDDIVVNENENQNANAPVFTATIEGEGATRTTIADGSEAGKKMVNWSDGDQISINGSLYSTTSTTNTATFFLVDGQTAAVADGSSKYKAYYPASLYNEGTPTLPAEYTYTDGKFDMPMYAESENTTLAFKNICGVLAITVPSAQMTSVQKITVSSDDQMNGAFYFHNQVLDFSTPSLVAASRKVTLVCNASGSNTTIPQGGYKTFYVPIKSNNYGYLKIDVTDGTTTKTMKTTAASVPVGKNEIYPISFVNNYTPAPTTGTAKATINGNKVDVAWVQLWENGPKWATNNVGATAPEGYGDYFAWGATEPWYESGYSQEKPGTHWKSGKEEGYTFANAPYQTVKNLDSSKEGTDTKWTKYLGSTTSTYKDDSATDADALKGVLDPEDDAAHANWGGSWRMPTKTDLNRLNISCSWTWTTLNGVNGYKVQSNEDGYTDNWIFLPAGGFRANTTIYYNGGQGYYWSSDVGTVRCRGILLDFSSSKHSNNQLFRAGGYSIRPVFD